VRDILTAESPEREVRRLMDTPTGFDPAVWLVMTRQLGLQAIAIPERCGGAGAGWTEPAIVFEELCRALLVATYFGFPVGHGGLGLAREHQVTVTSAVLRNVAADAVLRLPREPRFDTGIPWRDIPRTPQDYDRKAGSR
jgi:alkylation response protein AidB-like acyl-CoA dehydrogenase